MTQRVTRLPRLNDASLYESLPNMKMQSEDRAPSRGGRPSLPNISGSPRHGNNAKSSGMESPRMFDEVEYTEEELLAMELKTVKNERNVLLQDLNTIKSEFAESGADMQKDDLCKMEKHLEYKKHKYNELHEDVLEKEKGLQKLENQATDSKLRVPEEMEAEQAQIGKLKSDMKSLEDDLVEAEAKNRLYTFLEERTRREHMAMEKKVREVREMKEDCLEDHAALTSHMHDMRAAKEESEKKLAQMKAQFQQSKSDWERKLSLRKKEVVELRKRQDREKEKEERKATKIRERDEKERQVQAEQEMQMEAYELQCAALAPKIEAMEASWNRLRSISGAQTTEDVIGYFFSLRSKEENMREMVAQAEKREAKAKQTLGERLDARSEMFESSMAGHEATFEEHKARIDDAERRLAQAKKRFNRLRSVCISAEQGVKFLMARLLVAVDEPIEDLDMKAMLSNMKTGKARAKIGTPGDNDGDDEGEGEADINTIDDIDFFPNLVDLLNQVGDRLNKMLAIEEQYKESPPMPEPEPEPEPERIPTPEPEPAAAGAEEGGEPGAEAAAESTAPEEAEPAAVETAAAEGEEPKPAEDGEEPKPDGEGEAEADAEAEAEPASGEIAAPEGDADPAAESGEVSAPAAEGEEAVPAAAEEAAKTPSPRASPPRAEPPVELALSDTQDSLPEEQLQKTMKDNEAKLAKGMKRTEWCGPSWMETVSGSPIMPGGDVTKRKKGKKKKQQAQPDLTRILGYCGSDVEEEDEDEEEDEEDEEEEWDGLLDRDFIKHRSAKMTYKAQAMQQGGRM